MVGAAFGEVGFWFTLAFVSMVIVAVVMVIGFTVVKMVRGQRPLDAFLDAIEDVIWF